MNMIPAVRLVVAAVTACGMLVLSRGVVVGQTTVAEPIHTTLCAIVKAPEQFNFKMVHFRATIHAGF
jgi:hypothetical protein